MSSSACPTCGHGNFELTDVKSDDPEEPERVRLVRCADCGTVVGALDDMRDVLGRIEKRLAALERKSKT